MTHAASRSALEDLTAALGRHRLVTTLGWRDVRLRYRRSVLGPLWITLSLGITIATIGVVFGQIFQAPMGTFLPFLALGMILWSFVSSVVTEGCQGFVAAEGIIKALPIPLVVHILRLVWRNVVVFLHNMLLWPIVALALGQTPGWVALWSLPGFALLTLNVAWVALLLGIVCARYRDLPQIVGSILQIAFYVTPIMWMPSQLPARAGTWLLDLNPMHHLLEVVRAPLLGQLPAPGSWAAALGLALVGWGLTLPLYARARRRIAYWL